MTGSRKKQPNEVSEDRFRVDSLVSISQSSKPLAFPRLFNLLALVVWFMLRLVLSPPGSCLLILVIQVLPA